MPVLARILPGIVSFGSSCTLVCCVFLKDQYLQELLILFHFQHLVILFEVARKIGFVPCLGMFLIVLEAARVSPFTLAFHVPMYAISDECLTFTFCLFL